MKTKRKQRCYCCLTQFNSVFHQLESNTTLLETWANRKRANEEPKQLWVISAFLMVQSNMPESQRMDQLSRGGDDDDDDAASSLQRRRRLSSAALGSLPSSSGTPSSRFSFLSVSEAQDVESAGWEEDVAPLASSAENRRSSWLKMSSLTRKTFCWPTTHFISKCL